jgi:hypothetical protein
MERFWDLRRAHKKAWFGVWILVLVAVLAVLQWRFGDGTPIRTRVLGAQAKKPDTTPPSVSIAFPAPGGVYGLLSWGCASGSGVCGSSSDATGVARVEVAVRQQTGGKYWDGSAFASTPIQWLPAQGTTSWRFTLPIPQAEDSYVASVRATDTVTPVAAANTSTPVSVTFRVDRTAPTDPPTFTKTPDEVTFETKAQFNYLHAEAAKFECTLDGTLPSCGPQGLEFKNLDPGTHTFTVVAVDVAGNRSPATSWTWTILINQGVGISGNPVGPLSPGINVPLNLRISNPYNFTIRLLTVDVTVGTSSTNSCRVADNFDQPTRRAFTLSTPALIPAHGTAFLTDVRPSQDIWPADWPIVKMNNTAVNQDACKNATFTLSYSGTATKP